MRRIQDVAQIAILRASSRSKLFGFDSCNRRVAISCHDLILSNAIFIVDMLEISQILEPSYKLMSIADIQTPANS
jgi:hypothetical protein